jgi:heptosyltransferase II
MLDFGIYLLYRAGMAIASALPMRVLYAIGNFMGWSAWLLLPHYRRLARRNLKIAFANERSSRELQRICRHHFQRLAANLICSAKMGSMPLEKLARYLETENFDAVHRELRKGAPVVLLLSHIGAWEMFAQLFPHYIDYVRLSTVYQKLGNRYIDADVRRRRGRSGVEMFDRADGFHGPIELLRSGGLIGILGDQHAGDHGLWTPFFGRLASTSSLPGLLAKRTRAAVIAAAVYVERPARWRMVFTTRIDAPGDSANAITLKGNETIEQQIRTAPEDWFWVHNRWKTPKPSFLLTHYKRGTFVPSEGADLKPFRILIRSSNWLGDSVISMPAVRAIKAGRPDAHITIVAPEKIASAWKLVSEVNEIICLKNRSLLGAVRLIRQQQPFDVAILFPNSLRATLEIWLARVPRRVGYRGHCRRWLLNQVIPERSGAGPIEHQVFHYLRIVREVGGPSDFFEVRRSLAPARPKDTIKKIGLCPGAEYGPAKRWFPERFAEVATAVLARRPVQWILFGTSGDAEIGATIQALVATNCINRIGKTTLNELIAELSECDLLLTNDTGTMHLATILDVPVVAVFGSTEPDLTGPLASPCHVIRHQVECSPCFLRECPIDFRCMKAVTIEEVVQSVLSLLKMRDQPLDVDRSVHSDN